MSNFNCLSSTLLDNSNQTSQPQVSPDSYVDPFSTTPSHLQTLLNPTTAQPATYQQPDGTTSPAMPHAPDGTSAPAPSPVANCTTVLSDRAPPSGPPRAAIAATTRTLTSPIPHQPGEGSNTRPLSEDPYRTVFTVPVLTQAYAMHRTNASIPPPTPPLSYASMAREFNSPPKMRDMFKLPPAILSLKSSGSSTNPLTNAAP